MLEFSLPFWPLAIVAFPLIWWLHKRATTARTHYVSAIFLWPDTQHAQGVKNKAKRPPPIWILRALILAALLISLSVPTYTSRKNRIHIWLDDSASMTTREGNTTRFEMAIDKITQSLNDSNTSIVLHSLTSPDKNLNISDTTEDWQNTVRSWITTPGYSVELPDNSKISNNENHWLITDGADTHLNTWVKSVPLNRIIYIGQESENVSLINLSVRPSLDNRHKLVVSATVLNSGNESTTRILKLKSGNKAFLSKELALPAQTHIQTTTTLQYHDGLTITASLSPNDAFDIDDTIVLAADNLRYTPINISDQCHRSVKIAIQSIPFAQITETRENSQLVIACSDDLPDISKPFILLTHGSPASTLSGPAYWTPTAPSYLRELDMHGISSKLVLNDTSNKTTDQIPLLKSGNTNLITYQELPAKSIFVYFDISSKPILYSPVLPLLLLKLVEFSLDRQFSDSLVYQSIPISESRIAPAFDAQEYHPKEAAKFTVKKTISHFFIVAAIILLLFEILLRTDFSRQFQTNAK
jgi:hypothetical protein